MTVVGNLQSQKIAGAPRRNTHQNRSQLLFNAVFDRVLKERLKDQHRHQ